MPNVFLIRNPVISDLIWEKILSEIPSLIVKTFNTQGGLTERHVRIIPVNAWHGQYHDDTISLIVLTKKTPDYLRQQNELVTRFARLLKQTLAGKGLLNESQTVKVNLILADSITAKA